MEICFAEFLPYYYLESKINETLNYNDSQCVVLKDNAVEGNHKSCIYPKSFPLSHHILHDHKRNQNKYPEKYVHHLLFTFHPFCNEDNSKLDGSYFAKLQQSDVLDIINLNRQK